MKKINWKFWEWDIWNFCTTHPRFSVGALIAFVWILLFRLLYPPLFVWWHVSALIQKTPVQTPTPISGFGKLVWILVGVSVFVLCIQSRAKIIGWITAGSWKTARWWVGGTVLLALTVWAIVAGDWSAWFSTFKTEMSLFWRFVARPYCWWLIGGLMLLWLAIRLIRRATMTPTIGGATVKPRESLKKALELFTALAKLGFTLALIAVLAIFIVGPKMFWKGDYHYTPPSAPSGVAQATTAVPVVPGVPQSRTITIPVGDLNAPLEKWSEEVQVVPGWNFRCELRPMGKMGVLVDGAQKVVSEPGRDTPTHATKSLRFVSLTGTPLQMRVDYFR